MSAEIVNLRQARKRKARAEKETRADKNRQKFGQTKAEKDLNKARASIADKHLDGHKLDQPND